MSSPPPKTQVYLAETGLGIFARNKENIRQLNINQYWHCFFLPRAAAISSKCRLFFRCRDPSATNSTVDAYLAPPMSTYG